MIQDIPLSERIVPDALEPREREICAGALAAFGVDNPVRPTAKNLNVFTWEQVLYALQRGRLLCSGDALDDVDDTIYAVRDARRAYASH